MDFSHLYEAFIGTFFIFQCLLFVSSNHWHKHLDEYYIIGGMKTDAGTDPI